MNNHFFLVIKDSPAFDVVKNNIEKMKPGAVIPVTPEELKAWRKDVHVVDMGATDPRIDTMWQYLGLDPKTKIEITPHDDKRPGG